MKWELFETAPADKMFVAIAIDVPVGTGLYTSDPWCVFWATNHSTDKEKLARWPHAFSPTHWAPIPMIPGVDDDQTT